MRNKYYLIYCYNFNVYDRLGEDLLCFLEHRTDDFDEHIAVLKRLRGMYDLIRTEMRKEEE